MDINNKDLQYIKDAISRLAIAIEGGGIARKYCSVAEIANMLSISKGTWWGWVREGIAPAPVRIGNTTRWNRVDVYAFVDAHSETTDPPEGPEAR